MSTLQLMKTKIDVAELFSGCTEIAGRGCFPKHFLKDFLCVQRLWQINPPCPWIFFTINIQDKNCFIRSKEFLQVAGKISRYFDDFQCFYGISACYDRADLHFCINCISYTDGSELVHNSENLDDFASFCNKILADHHMESIGTILHETASKNEKTGGFDMDIYEGNNNWYEETADDVYEYNDDYDSDDAEEDDDPASARSQNAFRRHTAKMVPMGAIGLLDAYERHNSPKRREHNPFSENEDDSYYINGSRNLTIRLDDISDVSKIQNHLELFRQSDEERKQFNVIGIAVADEFEHRNIKRKITVDCSMNITLDLCKKQSRKNTSHDYVDTHLVDDVEE